MDSLRRLADFQPGGAGIPACPNPDGGIWADRNVRPPRGSRSGMRARAGQHQVFTSPGRGSRRAGAVRGARREGIALPKSGATTRPFPNGPNWVRSARSSGGHIGRQIPIPLDLVSPDGRAEIGFVRPFFHRFPARWSPPRLGSFGQFFADFPRDDPRRARPAIGFVRPEFRDSPRVETSELRRSGGRQDPPASYDQRGTARYFMILEIISKIFGGWGRRSRAQ